MEITGKLVEIFDTVQINDSFRKREFVVEYSDNTQYPEFIKFELFQDKAELMDGYKVGEEIEVAFNLKGRKWNDPKGGVKYFNTLQAWKVNRKSAAAGNTDAAAPTEEPEWLSDQDDENVLPF